MNPDVHQSNSVIRSPPCSSSSSPRPVPPRSLAGEPRLIAAAEDGEKLVHPPAKADACILLWMGGGMAAPDTFDPKKYVPFEVGVPVGEVESTFPAIDTVVDNIKITQGLENIAQVMDRGTLIRSHVLPDLGQHPALAASVSLAHRLRPAADRRLPAHRRVDGPRARAAESGHSRRSSTSASGWKGSASRRS